MDHLELISALIFHIFKQWKQTKQETLSPCRTDVYVIKQLNTTNLQLHLPENKD